MPENANLDGTLRERKADVLIFKLTPAHTLLWYEPCASNGRPLFNSSNTTVPYHTLPYRVSPTLLGPRKGQS